MEERLRGMERKLEIKEREERRKNIVIKGLEVKEEKRREAVEELMKRMGVEVEIREVKKMREEREKGEETVLVRLGKEEQRKEIMKSKKKLKGRKERVMEDLTWRERKMRWNLEEIARKEGRKGKKVWIGYGRIQIEEQWWKWDEEEEVLRDGKGRMRVVDQGEGKRGGERGIE
ncbi:PREDICTED: trichohyalin-like [Wasmannia auropunctata]|uniref:trichohyalin-like n=1 Tax=Wasmannia auropunctata TaxID=64793 RepID=UPI0005EE899F|nr:PREDICTED: trichohyalin-like [Wasmannia auropunctata]